MLSKCHAARYFTWRSSVVHQLGLLGVSVFVPEESPLDLCITIHVLSRCHGAFIEVTHAKYRFIFS